MFVIFHRSHSNPFPGMNATICLKYYGEFYARYQTILKFILNVYLINEFIMVHPVLYLAFHFECYVQSSMLSSIHIFLFQMLWYAMNEGDVHWMIGKYSLQNFQVVKDYNLKYLIKGDKSRKFLQYHKSHDFYRWYIFLWIRYILTASRMIQIRLWLWITITKISGDCSSTMLIGNDHSFFEIRS